MVLRGVIAGLTVFGQVVAGHDGVVPVLDVEARGATNLVVDVNHGVNYGVHNTSAN
jgi:hypothetical protein